MQSSVTSAYMWAFIVMAVFFLLAALVANLIQYKPNDPGTSSRRVWFWIFCALTGVVGFSIDYAIGSHIQVPTQQSNFMTHAAIATGVAVVVYIILGFIVSKIFSSSKVGTWF